MDGEHTSSTSSPGLRLCTVAEAYYMFETAMIAADPSHLATLGNSNFLRRLVVLMSPHVLDLPHHVHAINNLAEDNVLAVQVW